MTRLIRGLIAATALLLALPALAGAATRYAEPSGDGDPSADCPLSNPCSIQDAIEGPTGVDPGDTAQILPGTYNLGGGAGAELITGFGLTLVEGAPGQPVPTIQSSGGNATIISGFPITIRRLRIEASAANSWALNFQSGGIGEQVQVTATGTAFGAVLLRDGSTLRDSTAWAQVNGGEAISIGGTGNSTIRNVTAIATGTSSRGISLAENFCTGTPGAVTCGAVIDNTIARGTSAGLSIDDDGTGGDDNMDFLVTNSNYSSIFEEPPDADVQLFGANQTTAPLFVNDAAGDFRQRPGSVTIDAGTPAGISALDLEGQPRIQGPAPDIGADEAADPGSLLSFGNVGQLKRKRSVTIPASCPLYACNLAAAANLVVKGKPKPATASRVIKLQNVSASFPAGAQQTLTFKLSKKAFKSLQAAKKARLTVSAAVTVSLGFSGTESASFKFKKAGRKK